MRNMVMVAFLAGASTAVAGVPFGLDHLGETWERAIAAVAAGVPAEDDSPGELRAPDFTVRGTYPLKEVLPEEVQSLRLLGPANVPLKVLMQCGPDTLDEVHAVFEVVAAINEEEAVPPEEKLELSLIADGAWPIEHLQIPARDFERCAEVNRFFVTDDPWMQDWGEVAAVRGPGSVKERLVILDTNRGRGLERLPAVLAKLWSGHYLKKPGLDFGSGDYGGNIEVTPDDFLVVGSTSTPALRELLARGGYEGRTAVVDTAWLHVGHVDEYLAFLPAPETERGFVIVKADPALALDLIDRIPDEGWDCELEGLVANAFSQARRYPRVLSADSCSVENLVRYFVGPLHASLHGSAERHPRMEGAAECVAYNRRLARHIDGEVAKLQAVLRGSDGGTADAQVVPWPVLFADRGSDKALALVPNAVNMLVLRDHLVVPHPLLPVFAVHVERTARSLGYVPHLVPNLTYHRTDGQLHCGTNIFRHPNRFVHRRYDRLRRARAAAALHASE